MCFRRDNQPGKTTWSPASRVIGHEGSENQNVWVLCENIPVSAQNIRPAGDAEALAHAILHGHSIIPEAIVRGQQEFEDATAVPAEDGNVGRHPLTQSLHMKMMAHYPQFWKMRCIVSQQ